MASDLSDEQKQALWMLDKMRSSEEFLTLIRAQRARQSFDALDTPEAIVRHAGRVAPLYQGETAREFELPAELVAAMVAAERRDVLSCLEELIEKAIEAYLRLSPKGEEDVPAGWKSTLALAEAEIRGEVRGQFAPGFVALLAGRARAEQALAGPEPEQDRGRERD